MTRYGVEFTRWQLWRIRRWQRHGQELKWQRYVLRLVERQTGRPLNPQ